MMIFNRIFMVFFVLILTIMSVRPPVVHAQGERKFIREGNKLYQKELFDDSELSYRRALERDEDSPHARFNLGNSLYKQGRYDEATGFFGELAGVIDDPLNRSKVFHNLGNSLLMSEQIEQSIEAYKEALRNNPGDSETRYNLAFAQHLLDQQQEDDSQDQDGDDQQDEQDDQNDQDNQDDQEDQDEQDQNEGDDQENQQDDRGDQEIEDDRQQDQPRPDQISPEDAMRMLEAAEREEQQVQEKLMEKKASEKPLRTGRNW
jgi:Ca-activated chloride channel homolog